MTNLVIRSALVWLLFMIVESGNGVFREIFIKPQVGDLVARQISFCISIVIISVIALITVRWIGAVGKSELFLVGLMWAVLTFGFEAFIVRPLAGLSWEKLAADYDPRAGGLMAFGMAYLIVIPMFVQVLLTNFRPGK